MWFLLLLVGCKMFAITKLCKYPFVFLLYFLFLPPSFYHCVKVEGVLTYVYPFCRNVTYLNPPPHKHIPEYPEGTLLPGKVTHISMLLELLVVIL